MRQAHATIASESPASTTSAAEHATNDEPVAKPVRRRKKKTTRKDGTKPTRGGAKRTIKPRGSKRPRGETAKKVARLLAKGMTPPAIARRLGLSDVTVYYHRQRLNEQSSESRALVPTAARADVPTSEAPTAEVLEDVETVRRPTKISSLAVSMVLEATSLAYSACWTNQRRLTRAERKILDACDALFGGDGD
jgi:transposase